MKISIQDIENSQDRELDIEFNEVIEELNKDIPLTANLKAVALDSEFIKIFGSISGKLNLVCDNCLKEFTKEISIDIEETFARHALFDEDHDEIELKDGSFIEDLNGRNEIDITDLVYQSVILSLPNKLVCDINCIGDEKIEQYLKNDNSDPRLDVFKSIKIEKDN